MKTIDNFLQEKIEDIKVGDVILIGKWKNVKATVKGFGKDENNQPIIKTDKGDVKDHPFRIQKLMPEK